MRNDRHKKYQYFINNLAKKNLLEGLAEQDDTEVNPEVYEAVLDMSGMPRSSERVKYFSNLVRGNQRLRNEIINLMIREANSTEGLMRKEDVEETLSSYFANLEGTGTNDILNSIKNNQRINYRNVETGDVQAVISDLVKKLVNQNRNFKNFANLVSVEAPSEVIKFIDQGKTDDTDYFGTTKDGQDQAAQLADTSDSPEIDPELLKSALSFFDFDDNEVFFQNQKIGDIVFTKFRDKDGTEKPLATLKPLPTLPEDIADSPMGEIISNDKSFQEYIGSVYAAENSGVDSTEIDELDPESLNIDVDDLEYEDTQDYANPMFENPKEALVFKEKISAIQNAILKDLEGRKGANIPGTSSNAAANWYRLSKIQNEEMDEMMATPSFWNEFDLKGTVNRILYMVLPNYLINTLGIKDIPGLTANPQTDAQKKMNSAIISVLMTQDDLPDYYSDNENEKKAAEKRLKSIFQIKGKVNKSDIDNYLKLREIGGPGSELNRMLGGIRSQFLKGDQKVLSALSQGIDPTTAYFLKQASMAANGTPSKLPIPTSQSDLDELGDKATDELKNIDFEEAKKIITDLVSSRSGSFDNFVNASNYGRKPSSMDQYDKKPQGWTPGALGFVEKNKDVINNAVDDETFLKMLMTSEDPMSFMPAVQNDQSVADYSDPKGSYDFRRAKFIANYKRKNPNNNDSMSFYMDDETPLADRVKYRVGKQGKNETDEQYKERIDNTIDQFEKEIESESKRYLENIYKQIDWNKIDPEQQDLAKKILNNPDLYTTLLLNPTAKSGLEQDYGKGFIDSVLKSRGAIDPHYKSSISPSMPRNAQPEKLYVDKDGDVSSKAISKRDYGKPKQQNFGVSDKDFKGTKPKNFKDAKSEKEYSDAIYNASRELAKKKRDGIYKSFMDAGADIPAAKGDKFDQIRDKNSSGTLSEMRKAIELNKKLLRDIRKGI